jgi:glycosyltransferase involved in cell wall biosynthesis
VLAEWRQLWFMRGVRISIVTPSFRQFDWLKRCVRSVADQGVDVEHIVQDGGSGAELEDWVRNETRAKLTAERDEGMYDALNRGFARAEGEILAWLNCDEQYLSGALQAVEERFANEPELDVLLADNVVVDPRGNYLAHRFSIIPTPGQIWGRFPVASCALFFRKRVWKPFDTRWKSTGDWWWFREMMLRGARMGLMRRLTSAFTETQANLGLAPISREEQTIILNTRPRWVKIFAPLLLAMYRWRMWRSGTFAVKPFRYAIYTGDQPQRQEFIVDRPTARWIRQRGVTPDVDLAK